MPCQAKKGLASTAAAPKTAVAQTIRLRLFKAIAKSAEGLSEREALAKIGLEGSTTMILKDEALAEKPRLARRVVEGKRAAVFVLTKLGKKHLENDQIDEFAAPSSAGKSW